MNGRQITVTHTDGFRKVEEGLPVRYSEWLSVIRLHSFLPTFSPADKKRAGRKEKALRSFLRSSVVRPVGK